MSNKRVVGGIDFSMTSPALTIHIGNEWSFDNCYIYYITSKKKFGNTSFFGGRIQGLLMPEYDNDIQRFSILGEHFAKCLDKHGCLDVAMEGYSMGSRSSRTFQIGENGGILKYLLTRQGVDLKLPAPTEIKKYATGSGRADKQMMYDAFKEKFGVDILSEFGLSKVNNPVDDIVDSYWIAKYNFDRG